MQQTATTIFRLEECFFSELGQTSTAPLDQAEIYDLLQLDPTIPAPTFAIGYIWHKCLGSSTSEPPRCPVNGRDQHSTNRVRQSRNQSRNQTAPVSLVSLVMVQTSGNSGFHGRPAMNKPLAHMKTTHLVAARG